jgi:hypothetical protein
MATVYKVQTLVDGGVRVTLDLPETAIMQMAQLAECQRFGVVLEITCKTEDKQNDASMAKRTKRKSEWTTQEEAGTHTST